MYIDVRHPEASCLALRGWLDAHAPELLHSLTAEDAQDLVEDMEGCL